MSRLAGEGERGALFVLRGERCGSIAGSIRAGWRLVRLAVCGPFDEAAATIAELTGVTVPKRSAE